MPRGDHVVQWHGTYRGTDEDPRETGWCTRCEREVYDGESARHRKAKPRGGPRPNSGPKRTRPPVKRRLMLELSESESADLNALLEAFPAWSAADVIRFALSSLRADVAG